MGHNSGRPVVVWNGSYYPDAGELTAWEEVAGWDAPTPGGDAGASVGDRMAAIFAGPVAAGPAEEPPAADNSTRKRSGRRARSRLRRYSAANRLDRLVVLTYRTPQFDLAQCKRDVREFLRRRLGPVATHRRKRRRSWRTSSSFGRAWAVTWEQHESGAWHVNVLLNVYVPHAALERAWGHGYVWITRFQTRRGGRDGARAAARYVAKYVGKDIEGMASSVHRYEVAQGFQPRVVRLYASSFAELLREPHVVERDRPSYIWQSIGEPSFTGPPVAFASW